MLLERAKMIHSARLLRRRQFRFVTAISARDNPDFIGQLRVYDFRCNIQVGVGDGVEGAAVHGNTRRDILNPGG